MKRNNRLSVLILFTIVIIMVLAGCSSPTGGDTTQEPFVPGADDETTTDPDPVETEEAPDDPATEETEEDCENSSDFVEDINLPDRTEIPINEPVIKTWLLVNDGTCTWNNEYLLVQTGGTGMLNAEQAVPLPEVAPGEEVEVSVVLRLSENAVIGHEERASFQIQDPDGNLFGATPYAILIGQENIPTPTPRSTSSSGGASINGTVWLDHCTVTAQNGGTPSEGCVEKRSGGHEANGVLDEGEAGMANVLVELLSGTCPSTDSISITLSAQNGEYSFQNLAAGTYCVQIDALHVSNMNLLIPGSWTYPDTVQDAAAYTTVTISNDEAFENVNFGWDYQFD